VSRVFSFSRGTKDGKLVSSALVEGIIAVMPDSTDNSKTDESTTRATNRTIILFWLWVWCGTSAAGGVWGAFLGWGEGLVSNMVFINAFVGGFFGLIVGVPYACIVAVPIIATLAIMCWRWKLSRFRVVMGGVAGGLTGVVAMLPVFSGRPPLDLPSGTFLLPGWIGMIGGTFAGAVYCSRITSRRDTQRASKQNWRFTLRHLFALVAALATISAAVAYVAAYTKVGRQRNQNIECRHDLEEISDALREYEKEHGCLPPAYVADDNGSPLLSWRVLLEDHAYDYKGKAKMDFSKPWDSPTNRNGVGDHLFQCQAIKEAKPGITHYGAVVGPGTLWQDNGPNGLLESEKRILVVEWPQSDIHWAEPRDITVEELLDWLKSKPGQPDTNHPECLLYVDGSGEVGELCTDSDPETVRRLLVGEAASRPIANKPRDHPASVGK